MLREYIPQWIAPSESPQTRSDGTDKTDKSPFVSFVSALPSHLSRNTPETAESLKAAIVEALDVEPADFDRERYDHLWRLWREHNPEEAS